jgi:arylsulfatase A-like enzyme
LDTSPNIDRLAKYGVLFSDCTVQWPLTWPSMASMNTGAYPKTTGIEHKLSILPDSFYMLSEIFGEAGYNTGAVVANFTVGKKYGFAQGFDHFVESWQEMWEKEQGDVPIADDSRILKKYTNATIVTDQALEWIDRVKDGGSFFLWLHYMDPHGPYIPPREYRAYFRDSHETKHVPLSAIPKYQRRGRKEGPITDLGFYKTEYDREIKYLDDEIGRLISELSWQGLDMNTLIVFSADHGESLDEHDYYLEHGKLPYQPSAYIPLILVQKGKLPSGKMIKHPVGLIDLSATVLDLAGIGIPASFEGQSLKDLILSEGEAPKPEYVFMQSGRGAELTVRSGKWKLIHFRNRTQSDNQFELYDIHKDPTEMNNVAPEHPEVVRNLSKVLHEWFKGGPRFAEKGKEIDIDSLDEKSREMLKSLGYIK